MAVEQVFLIILVLLVLKTVGNATIIFLLHFQKGATALISPHGYVPGFYLSLRIDRMNHSKMYTWSTQ